MSRHSELTTADLRTYITERQDGPEALSNATLNRDLALLRRAYRLAIEAGRLLSRPHIPRLKEAAPRKGFFEPEQFEAVRRHLPKALRPVVTFAYLTGWRVPSEVLPLTWAQVNFEAGVVRLEPGSTKNDEARTFPFTPELRALLEAQRATTEVLQRQTGRIIPWVFHRRGRPIKDFRGSWESACKLAGCPGRIPHDFRRTASRNMVRAGVPERVAMQLSGHKTRAVFERYNIVSEGDLQVAAEKLAEAATRRQTATVSVTVGPSAGVESRGGVGQPRGILGAEGGSRTPTGRSPSRF